MIEDIYKWLETSGWSREIIDDCWAGYHVKIDKFTPNAMIVNGRRVDTPQVTIKKEIEYTGDGWISNSDGSELKELTEWDVRVYQGDGLRSITIMVDSLDQFIETINEMNI